MPMGVTLAKAGLARKMALEYECYTCRIYLMLAGILHPIFCTAFIHSIRQSSIRWGCQDAVLNWTRYFKPLGQTSRDPLWDPDDGLSFPFVHNMSAC